MQVTVGSEPLNVRTELPSVNAPNTTYLQPGATLEIDGIMYKGDPYAGNDVWVKDSAGNCYWSGALNFPEPLAGVDYRSFLSTTDQDVLNTQGAGVTVVIIDSGINFNGDYFNLSHTSNADVDTTAINDNHGVFIGGIIGGIKNVFGIASNASILSVKYESDNLDLTGYLTNLIQALQTASQIAGPLVVNLSQSFAQSTLGNNANEVRQITTLIQQITGQPNKFIVCAAGDNSSLSGTLEFPANLPHCLSVGTLNQRNINTAIATQLNIVSAMASYSSFNLDYSVTQDLGSSFAAAIISALVSCHLSKNVGITLTNASILSKLAPYVTDRSAFQFSDLQSFQIQINQPNPS
jgi:subtilisin family serine protease